MPCEEHTAALKTAFDETLRYLKDAPEAPIGATLSLEELREKIALPLHDEGLPPQKVIEEMAQATKGGLMGCTQGRFFAWVTGGTLPSGLAADWLATAWDQNAVLYDCGPAVSVIEETVGKWLLELLDLPRESSFSFTTGCQMANFTALCVARNKVLEDEGRDATADGLTLGPQVSVLANEHRHSSIDRAASFLGLGRGSIIPLKANDKGEVLESSLKAALKNHLGPKIVVLNAGDLNQGSFDPFSHLIPLAHKARAWVHIDGAFGLFARVSKKKRYLTEGLELADSWATDAHKWPNAPYDCGVAIIRNQPSHRKAMTVKASYITPNPEARNPIDWTPEWSRRARAVPLYAIIRELGRKGFAELIDRCCHHCKELVRGVGALPGVQVLHEPELNQGLLRFLDTREGATEKDHNKKTQSVVSAINASGTAFFSTTRLGNALAIRVSVVNWKTSSYDIQKTITAFKEALGSQGKT